jgi:alkylhydroperoxidase family enzyme
MSEPVLVSLLEKEAVPFPKLHERYGALLSLVNTLIGVVPNCDPYLEIWPPAFRSYNVMVPNLLNLPFLIWGIGAPRATLGLAMYASSRAAACPYCAAHCCSFALRRGATVNQVASALDEKGLSPTDRAAVRVARALGSVPSTLRDEDRQELRRHVSPAVEEWIILSVAMMGWLNKTMNGLGIPLEESTVAEVNGVIAASGWTPGAHLSGALPANGPPPPADSLRKRVSIVRHAPKAIGLDKQWTKGVPDRWPAVGTFLRERTGHDWPILNRLRHRRAIRAIATMLRDNLTETVVGKAAKLGVGLIYAEVVESPSLAIQLRAAGAVPLTDPAIIALARAVAPSPSVMDDAVMTAAASLSPAAIVEVVTFIALMQLIHRLQTYYPE